MVADKKDIRDCQHIWNIKNHIADWLKPQKYPISMVVPLNSRCYLIIKVARNDNWYDSILILSHFYRQITMIPFFLPMQVDKKKVEYNSLCVCMNFHLFPTFTLSSHWGGGGGGGGPRPS